MLVIRNFGFLGLHSAIHSHSKLARDRLVDFTGEIQTRRRSNVDISDRGASDIFHNCADAWHQDFVGEPVENGGRNIISFKNKKAPPMDDLHSKLYAKELGPIPLSLSLSNTRPLKIPYNGLIDAGIPFHTSFCNELLCQPLLLQNSSKRNITVKVEVRKLHFCGERKSYVATSLQGPAIHNNRRGPFLVNEAYTSCAYHTVDPHFLDEFKIKLPFNLAEDLSERSANGAGNGKLIIFFSVYNVSVKEKKKWSLISKQKGQRHDGEDNSENCERNPTSPFPQELLGCGFLPLCPKNDSTCLISDGKHDVKLKYLARPYEYVCSSRQSEEGLMEKDRNDFVPESLILEPIDPLALVERESIHGTDLFPEIWDQCTAKSSNELLADVDDILQQTSDRFNDGPITDNMRSESDVLPHGHLSTPSSISSLSAATDSVSSRKKKDREIIHHLRKTSRLNESMILKVSKITFMFRQQSSLFSHLSYLLINLVGTNHILFFSSPSE